MKKKRTRHTQEGPIPFAAMVEQFDQEHPPPGPSATRFLEARSVVTI